MSDLTGKIALVTGSASGIGRASAMRLAADGADIALLDINSDGIEETAQKIRAIGRKALTVVTDLLDRKSIDQALTQIRAELGTIDILKPSRLRDRTLALNRHPLHFGKGI